MLGLGNVPSIELAQKLVKLAPAGLNKVFYSDSGSTAVEAALKIAYQYHRQKSSPEERSLFVTISQAYHGDTIGSVSVGGIDLFHQVYGKLLFKTLQLPAPVAYRFPEGFDRDSYLEWTFKEAERIITEHASTIAAVVMEPTVQGAAGILVHPQGYLKHIRAITAMLGIPLICDEVAVGFGRTGTMFACEQEHVAPDMLCLAKGLTGGYLPLAATLTQDYIYEAFLGEPQLGRTFFHGHTFTGNPLGCAAAIANLELFEAKQLLDHVKEMSALAANKLAALSDQPNVGEIRQQGMMIGIELVANRGLKTSYDPALRIGHQVTLAARKHGVIIRPLGDVIVLMPALAMPGDLLELLCDVTLKSINEVCKKDHAV
jgi:adenosylmethionine-8-amino-7-oxononanoate aminotransferase